MKALLVTFCHINTTGRQNDLYNRIFLVVVVLNKIREQGFEGFVRIKKERRERVDANY